MDARCDMCGRTSTPSREGLLLCVGCLERYDEQFCSRCGIRWVVSKTIAHSDVCSLCELRERVKELPKEQREAIRQLAKSGQRWEAIKEATRALGVTPGEAAFVAGELAE